MQERKKYSSNGVSLMAYLHQAKAEAKDHIIKEEFSSSLQLSFAVNEP